MLQNTQVLEEDELQVLFCKICDETGKSSERVLIVFELGLLSGSIIIIIIIYWKMS